MIRVGLRIAGRGQWRRPQRPRVAEPEPQRVYRDPVLARARRGPAEHSPVPHPAFCTPPHRLPSDRLKVSVTQQAPTTTSRA